MLPGENDAIQTVVKLAHLYGYGNLIARLKEAWIEDLMQRYGVSWEAAVQGADANPTKPPIPKKHDNP